MVPTLGRTVHYVMPEGHPSKGQHRAAVINTQYATTADGDVTEKSPADLTVFLRRDEDSGESFAGATGLLFATEVQQDPTGKQPGTFHEPERQAASPVAAAAPAAAKK